MKLKKIVSVLLSAIIILTSILSVALITQAETSEKTMFHLNRASSGYQRVLQKITVPLEADVEYTVSLNSKYVTGTLNSSNLFFNLYGAPESLSAGNNFSSGTTALRSSGQSGVTSFDAVNFGSNTQYTFTLTSDEIDGLGKYYIGWNFENRTSGLELYVGDFVLYKTNDTAKTNLLTHDDYATSTEGWVNLYGNSVGSTISYVTYDATYFPMPEKTMFHYSRNGTWNRAVQKLNTTLEENVEYTVSFDSKFVSGESKIWFGLYGDKTLLRTSRSSGTAFSTANTEGSTTTYTFTLTESEISGKSAFYVGWYFEADASLKLDFYVADFVLYESADASKTNLLTQDDYSTEVSAWYNDNRNLVKASDTITVEYIPYDESYFPEPEPPVKTMFHYSRNGTWNSVVQKVKTALEANVEYTVSFDSKFASGGSNTWFGLYGATTLLRTSRSSGTAFSTANTVGSTTTYTFTLTESEISGKSAFYVGWYFEAVSTLKLDFYIADFVLYRTDDTSKTNLLTQDEYSTEVSAWYNDNRNLVEASANITVEYIPYDESYFPAPQKTMLHVKTSGTNSAQTLIQQSSQLKAGTEYTLSFNYKFENGAFDNDLLCVGLFGYNGTTEGKKWNQMLRESRDGVGATALFDNIQYSDTTAEYTFTLSEAEVSSYTKFLVGFYFIQTNTMITEFYVADMVMYETADSTKANLLAADAYTDNTSDWYRDYGAASAATAYTVEYVPYIAEYFEYIEPVYYGDLNADYIIDILDLVMLHNSVAGSAEYLELADINKDQTVDASDVLMVRKHIIGTERIEWALSVMTFDALSGGADTEAATLKAEIMNAVDTAVSGNVYYVSNSSEANVSTIAEVNSLNLKAGDSVLFKRGDVFRTAESLEVVNGVHYGAYGQGDKPQILGSLKNYADADLWTSTDGVIWQTALDASQVGNIVFNGGEATGYYEFSKDKLTKDGDFWYDADNKTLYLYMNKCNPGGYFGSIEIASTDSLIYGKGNSLEYKKNISIENLTLKYASVAGIGLALCDGITVKNCEIGWIGGGIHSSGTRYGNGIELYMNASDCTISDNYIYQIYDAAITFQGPASNYSGISMTNNLIEYCSMNFEFWSSATEETTAGTITDITFSNNILRFGGYGFGGKQRSETRDQAYIFGRHYAYTDDQLNNFNITENTFDIANCNYFFVTESLELLNISGNTYYQQDGSYFEIVRASKTYVSDQATFETAISAVDKSATVSWLSAS